MFKLVVSKRKAGEIQGKRHLTTLVRSIQINFMCSQITCEEISKEQSKYIDPVVNSTKPFPLVVEK